MWSNKYIGIPFKDGGRDSNGLDCWGLVRLVYKNEYNIALPSFSSSYTTVDDTARLQELVDQYKEGWTQIAEPYEGSVVLLKTMGSATHVGVLVNNHQFLHVNEGTDVTVENLTSHRWNKRVIGYYKYSTERAAILNAAPHPLRTQLYTLPVTPGTTLKEISDWLFEKWQLSRKIAQKIIIIVNGQVVEQSKWSGFVVQEHDRIEYRALAGKGNGATIFRLVAMIAISFAAPYLAGALQASMSGNLFMTALAQQFAAGSAFLVSGWTGAALTAGITLAGSLLVNAIAPIRPPGQNTNDPGNAEAQLIATGTGNRLTPYESIPIVLGKMSITPPLGAVNYVTYQDERDTYLSLMLTWGYGPLVLVNSTPTLQASSGGAGLRIGELAASDYTIDAIEHLNMYHPSSGTLVALGGDQTKFDTIYGTDVAQHFRNLELVNNTHPFAGSVASPSPIEAAVAALPGGTPASERYTTIEIAVHFPQGLRKVKAQGENAGKSFALTDSANGGSYPVKVKYEWDIGSGWTAITSLTTAGEASGVVVYGTENKKDAFTKTHTVDLPTPTTVGVKVRATRLTGGWADPPQEGTSEYNSFTANSGSCYVYSVQTASRSDDNYTYTDSYDVEAIDNSITTRAACDAVLGRWVADSNALIKQAEDWRFAHQVNLLSLTVRRNAKPTKNPPNSTITKTAIRLKSSQEINGQLEGINAVVQTYGRDWKGGNSLTIDKSSWTFDAIDNPASLLLHVLISSANPRQIAWNDVETRVDLSKLQYWHYYCQQKGFKYNAIVAQQRSMLDVMRDICAAGRASPSLVDGKWTVVIDEPKANIVQHFSPHNSWGFEGTRVLNKLPEGLRVNYYDESDNYQNSEIILYKTGYNEDGSGGKTAAKLFETIQLPGVTSATLVEDHARWHMAQAKLRREVYTLNTDLEYVICNRGDRVTVTHDVPLWGSGSGRIKTRLDAKTYVLDEAVLINPAKQYQIKVRSNSYPLENTVATIVNSFTIASSVRASNIVTATVVDSYHPFSVGDILNITGSTDSTFNNATATVIEVTANTFKYEDAGSNGSNAGGTATLTQGLYQKIAVSANIGVKAGTSVNLADSGDLFLFGETSRISNDLLVLGIDPTNSKSAKLTLVDYGVYTDPVTPANSYNIFNDYLTLSESTIFATNITLPESLTSLQLTDVPTITSLSSGVGDAEVVSPGVYRYRIRVSYSNNATSLSQYIQQVECQYDLVGVNDLERSIIVKYDANTVYIPDVDVGKTYKVKLRYITRDGITGPWSSESTHTVLGKTSNLDSVGYITAIQKGKFIELNPVINPMPVDFKHFEIRVWKTTKQNSDFWSYTSTVANGLITSSGVSAQPTVFKIVKSTGICTVDLTEFAQPRISEAGVVYNVACRAVDNAGNYSKYSALTFVTIRNIIPPPFKLIPQAGAINLHVEPPIVNSKLRDDVAGLKVWVYSTSKAANSLVSGDLKYDSPSLKANISDLDVEKTLYYRFAVTSLVDPSVYTISNEYSYIPRSFVEDRTDDLPPNPLGISVSAAISTIIVTLPSSTISGVSQSTDYNYSDYAAGTLRTNASSTHKSTVVYGIKANSLLQAVAFSAVQDSVLGEFEDKKIFTLPAEAGTIYALFFKYRNKAGRLSAGAEGPFMCETGLDMQKFLDMMANQITEGQLYKGLQSRISSVDRGEKRVAVEVSQLSDQYTVKIDNAGHVAGFGLSNTSSLTGPSGSTLSDGSPFSEFGVVADRFWVAAPAVVGSTAPTENWHGRVWVDTSGVGLNEGLIGGVTVVYNTYSPSIHNPITYASDSTYHYWELKTKTQLDKLQVDIGGYTNRGAWSATATYALKDYVYDLDSNVYYVCIKAYTPSTITNLATKNADKVGNFTATGTFAVDKTLYITGTETILTQANGGGKDSALKLGASYKSSGTFYYITSVSGSVFVLSLTRGGKPISTGIKSTTKYWSETKDPLGVVTGGEWISVPKSDMFPFIVNTTARTRLDTTGNASITIPPGVYINNAFIEDASITNAKIANAAIDSAKISELTASKIKGGTIDADLINAGALTVGKLDLQSLRNNINITWALAMPRLTTTAVERTVTLAKGIYEIIIYSSFYKEDTFSTSDGAVTEQATIVAEVSGIGGATCTGYGQWAKEVDSTKFEGKLTSKAGTVNSGSITISNVSGSGYIGEGGGSWSFSVTPTASGGTTTLTNDKVDGVAGKSQTVRLNTALTQVNRAQFNVTTAGDYTFRLNSPTLPSGTWLHAGTLSLLNYLSSAGAATHTLTIASSVNEGATLTGTLATTNIDAGTGYQWKIIHTGTVSNNSHYEEIAGGLTIGSNGSGTFSIKPINDKTTNPAGQAKTFTVEISKAGVGVVATSGTITVNDTSLGPTYSLAFSPGTINETDNSTTTGTVTATANAPTDGTLLYWVIKPSAGYVDNPAKYFSPTSGTITINSGSGTFTIKALEDNETTASKSFQIEVTNDIGSTITFASNPTVTVTDSSQTPGTGGSVSLSGIGNYFVTSPSASVSAGATVYFYPDGTWQAKESTGTTSSGNWFTPTTPGIGSKYWINVTSTSVTNSGGGGSHSSNLGWTQLGAMQNFYAEATGYRCVDPMTPILVDVEGTTVLAKDLQVGMQVYTMHEYTKYWDMFNIVAIQQTTKPKALVTFSDNTTLLVSTSHKFYIGNRQWKQLFDLVPGDFVASRRNGMKQITSIEDQGTGEVISIEVEDAHTYVANDMISHNIKLREASMYSAEYERAFTVQIANNASGTSATSQVVNIGGQVGTPL